MKIIQLAHRTVDELLEEIFAITSKQEIDTNDRRVLYALACAMKNRYENDVPKWIPVSERLPEDLEEVNITWVNRNPESYYESIKDKPFTATAVYYKGKWYWWSATVQDFLAEYGRAERYEISEETANEIEVIAWMPLPEPYREENEK